VFSFSDFSEDYAPSDYAANLLNHDLDVTSLSVKIQLCREFVQSVLDYLKFPSDVIGNVNTVKVSQLMDSMDLFVSVAMNKKNATDLSGLTTIYDFLPAGDMATNIAVTANLNDAVSFIKDTINPDSVINLSSRKKGKFRELKVKKEEEEEIPEKKAADNSDDDSEVDSEEEENKKEKAHPKNNHSKVSKRSKKISKHLKPKAQKKPIIEVKEVDEDEEEESDKDENENEAASLSHEEEDETEDEDEDEDEEKEEKTAKRYKKHKKSKKSEVAKKRKSPASKKAHKTVRIVEEDEEEEEDSNNAPENDDDEDDE